MNVNDRVEVIKSDSNRFGDRGTITKANGSGLVVQFDSDNKKIYYKNISNLKKLKTSFWDSLKDVFNNLTNWNIK